jgi:hypothetical protein
MAAARSSERTVVFAHRGSVSVVDATYLGRVFNAVQMGLPPGAVQPPVRANVTWVTPLGEEVASTW